ncbi:MAG TPA: ATP-binding protein [Chloroflexota bacterium]|jgi:two-component system phosphate regulon sensor histidine kinase PhoR|nr:ATP-binding protein [Chloroflexota bacterium]
MSLRFKLQAAFLASVLVIAALATWAVDDRITAGARREADRQARAQTERVRAMYEQRAATLAAEGEAVSLYPAVIAALADGNAHPLLQWSGQVAALQGTRVTVTDAAGRVIARGHAPGRAGDDLAPALEGLRLALAGQKVSGTEVGDELGLAVRGYAPVFREGEVVGAVMLADPVDERLLGRLGGAGQGKPELRVEPPAPGGDDGCDPPVGAAVTCRFGLPSPAARPAATLALVLPLTDIEPARAEAQRTVWLAGALVLVLGALGAWLLSGSPTTLLGRLTRAADRAGPAGDAVGVGGDEIGARERAFDTTRERVAATTATPPGERGVLDAVLESTGDGVALVDVRGEVVVANGRWAALLGGEELAAAAELERVGGGTFGEAACAWLADPERVAGADFERRAPSYARFRCRSAPIPRRAGAPVGRIFVLRDVTRETEAERMRAALVSNVSHELRAPLTAIKGYVDTLLHGGPWDAEAEREFLQIVAHSADRLAGLVDNLLDAAKVEAGVLSLEREPVRVERVARRVVYERRPLLPADHSLEVEIGPELPPAYADPARVEQVIVNLVENAIKFSPDGGPIVVRVRCGADAVVVSVADRGVGVAPEHAEQLFERFRRAGAAAGRPAGLGLGLFICKSLVEAHGGRIWVESDGPGRGSTFAFTLPRPAAEAERDEAAVPHRLQAIGA